MNRNKKFIIIILAIFVSGSPSFLSAQNNHSGDEGYLNATIRVYDRNKEKLSGINLIYTDMETNQVLRKRTENGTALIQFPLNKTYLLVVSSNLYYTKTIEINTNIRKMGNFPGFYSDIEITLFENCENNPARSNILEYPIGRIVYNNHKTKFEYDFGYTAEMTELYQQKYEERCGKKDTSSAIKVYAEQKQSTEKNEENQNIKEENQRDKKITERNKNKGLEEDHGKLSTSENQVNLDNKQLYVTQPETNSAQNNTDHPHNTNTNSNQPSQVSSGIIPGKESPESVAEKADSVALPSLTVKSPRAEKFDPTKEFIYLQPKNSWPSELREYILNPDYKPRAIGTYAYTHQETKKEFYIDDVVELRGKFPVQFDQAFKNWDYLVEYYSKYKKK